MKFLFLSIKITGLYKSQFENVPEYRKKVSEGHKKKTKGNEIIDFDSLLNLNLKTNKYGNRKNYSNKIFIYIK